MSDYSKQAIVAWMKVLGYQLSQREFETWKQMGLVPSGRATPVPGKGGRPVDEWSPAVLRQACVLCAVQAAVGSHGWPLRKLCVFPLMEWVLWREAEIGVNLEQVRDATVSLLPWYCQVPDKEEQQVPEGKKRWRRGQVLREEMKRTAGQVLRAHRVPGASGFKPAQALLVHAALTPFDEVDEAKVEGPLFDALGLNEEESRALWRGVVAVCQQVHARVDDQTQALDPTWVKELTEEEWERARGWVLIQLAQQAQMGRVRTSVRAYLWDTVALLLRALAELYQARSVAPRAVWHATSPHQEMVEVSMEHRMLPLAERDPAALLPALQIVLTFWRDPEPVEVAFEVPGLLLPEPGQRGRATKKP